MPLPPYPKSDLAPILRALDLGSSVAETDRLLETARVETSVFSDLLADRVDLIPGTKGSGKSALYRIFVDFLPDLLLRERKVVIAHGVQAPGDSVFHAFSDRFGKLDENDFINFWCVYFVSLAYEHFLKDPKYAQHLSACGPDIDGFRRACAAAKIPQIEARRSLRDVLDWVLNVISRVKPKLTYKPPGEVGEIQLEIFSEPQPEKLEPKDKAEPLEIPKYISEIAQRLEEILVKANLHLWLMMDRLDEIFPRRSGIETKALRGLLRTLRIFQTPHIRLKIFLRDDIFDQVTSTQNGFPALTHVTARQADSLRWSEEQILSLIVKRLFTSQPLRAYLGVDNEKLSASQQYQRECFGLVFPVSVHRGQHQSDTLRWIYNHTTDGRGVVTPRDVIDLLVRAKQHQQDEFEADANGTADWVIGPSSILYGLSELSKRKKDTFLKAEFPHFWPHIEKFIGGKTEYTERALRTLLGRKAPEITKDLVGIGFLSEIKRGTSLTFKIPFLYREALELSQGLTDD
jgi:hypothetical protein